MRINEIMNESGFSALIHEDNSQMFNQLLSSVLVPLKAQGADKITVDQLMQLINRNALMDNINLDQTAVIDLLSKNTLVQKVEIDPENDNAMTVFLNVPNVDRFVNKDTKDKEKEDLNKAAMRTIKDKLK